MRARVGAMPQQKRGQHEQTSGRGRNSRIRVQSGMSLEDLKRQTAYRLAQEGGQSDGGENPNDESSDSAMAIGSEQTTTIQYPHPHHPQGHQCPREPAIFGVSQHMTPQSAHTQRGGRDYAPPYGYDAAPPPPNYGNESRNYTDSQLGVVEGASHGKMPQFGSSSLDPSTNYRPASQPLQQQNYSTPRMPRHATVLKDRGSAENSVGSEPSGGSDSLGYGYSGRGSAKTSPPSLKGSHRSGSHGKNLNKVGKSSVAKSKEMRSPDGRHTPVREHIIEGQILFATPTPNQRRSTPAAPYSEPPRRNLPHQNMSPNYNRMRSPDHHGSNYSKGGGFYNKNQMNKHQSKLPHGLTVQELKEMTRARLAAEAEVAGPEGSSDQSVHSAGTHGSSKGSDQYPSVRGSSLTQAHESLTRNLLQSNECIRREYSSQGLSSQSFQGQQQLEQIQQQNPPQYNFPRHSSPVFGTGPGPNSNQFNGNQSVSRRLSPSFALSSSQTRSQGEAWETASAASSEYHAQAEPGFHPGNNSAGAGMPFSSPSDSKAMTFNRGRCFSAGAVGASIPSSFEQYQAAFYEHVPLTGTANRQRCATVSPPGMSRLHEDRPFLFSTDDKERLAIPPLSEPRLRLHSTGGLNTHGAAMRAFNSSMSPVTNVGSGSAFVPIGKSDDHLLPQSPPPLNVDRTKFDSGDRTISTSSAASGHGDLPSSMAEAVLESITSTAGVPIGGKVIGLSPFRSPDQEIMVGESLFRVSSDSDNTSSAFRMDSLVPESSGTMSLFASEKSKNLLHPGNSGERLLSGTHSWGGIEDENAHSNVGLSHDFSNLLNLSGNNLPALRGRAATEPVWFGGNDPPFVSRIDPEHNGEGKGLPRVSSHADTDAYSTFIAQSQQGRKFEGC